MISSELERCAEPLIEEFEYQAPSDPHPPVEVDGGEDGLQGVGENRDPLPAAALLFSTGKDEVSAQLQVGGHSCGNRLGDGNSLELG